MSGLKFPAAVEVAGKGLRLLRDNGVEPIGGHVLGGSITFAIEFSHFGRLVASGSLSDVTFDRAAATDEISHHATIHHQAVLASYPDVRVLAVAIQRLPPAADPDTWPVPFGS